MKYIHVSCVVNNIALCFSLINMVNTWFILISTTEPSHLSNMQTLNFSHMHLVHLPIPKIMIYYLGCRYVIKTSMRTN